MSLTSEEFQQLHSALLDAYPSRGDLERLVRFRMDVNLNHIAGEGNLSGTVFRLIAWADARGQTSDLVEGAWEINPGNTKLKAFAQSLRQQLAAAPSLQPPDATSVSASTGVNRISPDSGATAIVKAVDNMPAGVTNAPNAQTRQVWRVVVASPGDVQAEREAVAEVVEELNRTIARAQGKMIELVRWEIDAVPGFSANGTQGVIDSLLQIDQADILIGIFWKRFGTPTRDAGSGTEHEFLTAYRAWQEKGLPQIMVYFNQKPYLPTSVEDLEQYKEVLEFKRRFPAEGLYWTYNGKSQFTKLIRSHLTQYLLRSPAFVAPSEGAPQSISVSSDTNPPATQNLEPVSEPEKPITPERRNGRARLFISYRHVEEDQKVAGDLYEALRRHHDVFIDQVIEVGTDWAARIQAELENSDFLIVLLSEHSINSEMVGGEVAISHRLAQQAGRPRILPVRLRYSGPLRYPLNAYLDRIQWAFWNGPQDTPTLVQQLLQAINGGALPHVAESASPAVDASISVSPSPSERPIDLENPEGSMEPASRLYVERDADRIAMDAIGKPGVTITIKGPRQMGKSSLLNRVIQKALADGKKVAFLDFQLFGRNVLQNADSFYKQFCSDLTDALRVEDRVAEYWETPISNNLRCTRYMGRHLLPSLETPVVVAMDEVDSVFDTTFRADFFAMLRSWHNYRNSPTSESGWKRLDLALVTSTEPYQFIDDLNQSPFNVGEVIELNDFTYVQTQDLNQRHSSPLSDEQLTQLYGLLLGHPYLTRRALYLLASRRITAEELFANASEDNGPFGDHLRYHLLRLYRKPDQMQALVSVVAQGILNDDLLIFRLRGAGLVRREKNAILPRCPLYAEYFERHFGV